MYKRDIFAVKMKDGSIKPYRIKVGTSLEKAKKLIMERESNAVEFGHYISFK